MNTHKRITTAVAGAAALLLLSGSAFAVTTPEGCSKAIDGEGLKTQSGVLKLLSSCYDAYRKDIVSQEKLQAASKPLLAPAIKAGPACQKSLDSVFTKTLPGEFAKLSAMVPAKCSDPDLEALGHLPTGQFGTRWAQFVVINALQSAYDQQIAMTRDFINAMEVMGGMVADTMTSQTVGSSICPACRTLASSPCQEHACAYLTAGTSSATVNTIHGGLTIPVPLTGVSGFRICNTGSTNLAPGITTAGEFLTFGETGKQLQPAPLAGLGLTACVKAIGSEGVITCNGGAAGLHVNYTTCQDHDAGASNLTGATASGECASQTVCLASSPDTGQAGTHLSTHTGVTNGGACAKLVPSNAAAGDSYINNTTQIAIVADTERGGDGKPCTNDDTNASPGQPATTSLTTGTASSVIHDADDDAGFDLASDEATGAPFPCGANMQSSNLAGAKIVGAFPALHAITLGVSAFDSVTSFTIQCN